MSNIKKHESSVLTFSSDESVNARISIFEMMNEYSATAEEKERSLGLFIRESLLARIFAISEIYKKIIDKPGVILDIGTWRGQTAVICENLRAIYEPLHFNRRIICFDTFEGYQGFSDKDRATNLHGNGTYSVEEGYASWLREILILHEKSNAMGHVHGKHKVIPGDCRKTITSYFEECPGEVVSLAFFDVNAFGPTLEAFNQVWSRLVPGGVMAFWQLTRDSVPAEGMVYLESILNKLSHEIHRTIEYPGLCYLIKK